MNATTGTTAVTTPAAGPTARAEPAVPNYALFNPDTVREVAPGVAAATLAYLRERDFRTTTLVLCTAGLAAVGVALAWPTADPGAARPAAAGGVAALLVLFGLAALLTDRRGSHATAAEERADQPADAGPGRAGPQTAGGAQGPHPGG